MAEPNGPPAGENDEEQLGTTSQGAPAVESTQAADQVAQTNLMTLGLGPAMAMVHAYLAQAHAQGIMFANSVHQQQQEAMVGLALASESAAKILDLGTAEG